MDEFFICSRLVLLPFSIYVAVCPSDISIPFQF